ncbi:MAG TPA: CHASE3 domain-containing protein [Lacunisphaera sp.]|nr:CHASE3 domain-containing protein [Lacunisphaera sp.]
MTDVLGQIRRIVWLMGGALLATGVMLVLAWWSVRNTTGTFQQVDYSHRVLYELETALTNAVSIQSGARGFGLTGDERYLDVYDNALLEIQHSIKRIQALVADNPAQAGRARRLASLVDEEVSVMQQRLAARRAGGLVAASTSTADGHGKKVVGEIHEIVRVMQDAERTLLGQRSSAAVVSAWGTLLVVAVAAAIVAALIAISVRLVRALPHRLPLSQGAR